MLFRAEGAGAPLDLAVVLPNIPAALAGAHAGVSVGPDGTIHQALEDLFAMQRTPQYHPPMRKLIAIFLVVTACSLALAATGPAVTKAYADSEGRVQIITADGRDHTIRPAKSQAGGGFDDIVVAQDGRTVGWLANYMLTPFLGNTNYSYAVALELDIWRDGRVIRKFSPPALNIQNWMFLKGGDEVAFHVAPSHGQEFYDCTLFDVSSGKEIAHWALDRKDYTVPDWAKELLANDPLPGPDEIHSWLRDAPTSTKSDPQSQQK